MGQSLAIPRVIPDDWKRLDLIINKIKFHLGSASSPTFAGLTVTGLTASTLIGANASKALESVTIGTGLDYTRPTLSLSHLGIEALTDPGADRIFFWDDSASASKWLSVGPSLAITATNLDTIQDIRTTASPEFVGLTLSGLTDDSLIYPSSNVLTSLGVASDGQLPIGSTGTTPVLATLTGSTDRLSVTNGAGSVTLDLAANTQTLLDSFNGIFLETIAFTISESEGTVTGSLEQDGTGDLIQRFSDGYSILDCTPVLTIDLTAYVGTDVIPVEVFVYILQSAKTVMAASNSDWPATEHIKVANLVLRSAATTGTDGGALVNRNWNDHAQSADSQGHITHIEQRIRQEPTQWDSGVALTLKDSAGNALNTGNSSTAVELVTSAGTSYQLHKHTFAAIDMYTTATDKAHIVNQPTDEDGAYVTTVDLVTDVSHYVDGTAAGVAIGVNKYFNLVIWGVQNRTGEISHLMINLPIGQYTNEAAAIADASGYSVFDLPAAFKGVGFLIARLTFRLIAGAQWTYIAQEDLRGQIPPSTAGVSITTTAHDLLANLDFASAGHTGFQAQGDVLDDLNITGVNTFTGDPVNDFLVGTAAGTLAWQYGATARASLGLTIGTHVQAYDAGLLSLAGLTYAAAAFVKMTGANTFVLRTIGETADDIQATIDHDLTANYVADKHVAHAGVSITAGKGLSGGGTIAATRDIALDLTEMTGNVIWNDGSTDASITWTYALSGANDPVWTIGANSMDLTTGVLKVGGTTVMLVGGAPTAHLHDGDTLEHDGVNSSAGAFAFTTGGIVTFSEGITMSAGKDLTIAGHIIFNTNNSYIGFADPRITFNDTGNQIEITGGLTGTSTAAFEGASVTVGKASTTTGTIVLHDSGSANTITLTVPNALAGSLSFTLPPTDGANTNVLQTDGNGVLTWVAAGGGGFIERPEVTAYDWTLTNLTTDETWRDLDCSSIVPSGAVGILFRLFIKDNVPGVIFALRKKGHTNVYSAYSIRTQVTNLAIESPGICVCDSNRVVQYWATNTTWTNIDILVLGWWL